MGLQLEPPDFQSYLPLEVLLGRLRAEFAFVATDGQAGADHVAPILHELETAGASERALAWMRHQHRLAVQVVVADATDHGATRLSFVVTPGKGLWIGFESDAHEAAACGLLSRCCRALGYIVSRDGGMGA